MASASPRATDRPRARGRRATAHARRDRQVVRLISILTLPLQEARLTVYQLAARFRTRRETIYRDLRALQDVGIPIVGDESGHLSRPRLDPAYRLSLAPVPLTRRDPGAGLGDQARGRKATVRRDRGDRAPQAAGHVGGPRWSGRRGAGGRRRRLGAGGQGSDRDRGRLAVPCAGDHWPVPLPGRVPGHRTEPAPSLSVRPVSGHLRARRLLLCRQGARVRNPTVLAVERIRSLEVTPETFEVDPAIDLKRYEEEAFGVSWEKPMTVVVRSGRTRRGTCGSGSGTRRRPCASWRAAAWSSASGPAGGSRSGGGFWAGGTRWRW